MKNSTTAPTLLLTFLLAALTTLGPFTVSTYLPSFPEIERSLAATPVEMQLTLSAYLGAFSVMTLWHGPVSDSFGRRRVILAGLVLYAAASLGCALVTRIEHLWLLRALQGLSAGAGSVIARAVARDLYEGPTAQKLLAHMSMIFALAPAAAPSIGGWLQVGFGWRSVFIFLGVGSAALAMLTFFKLPESLPPGQRQPFAFGSLARAYGAVLMHGRFQAWSLAYASMFGTFFIYVAAAPVFLTRHLQLGPTDFLWLFGPAMAGMMLGSWIAARTAGQWTPRQTLARAFAIMATAVVLNIAIDLAPGVGALWRVVHIPVLCFGMTLGAPTITVLLLDCFPDRRGLAAACQIFAQTLSNALIAALVAPWLWDSPVSLALGCAGLLVLAAMSTVLALWLSRPRQLAFA